MRVVPGQLITPTQIAIVFTDSDLAEKLLDLEDMTVEDISFFEDHDKFMTVSPKDGKNFTVIGVHHVTGSTGNTGHRLDLMHENRFWYTMCPSETDMWE